ncbi:L,D-transpeptidase family protein [Nocardioides sp.]|uniref:L,D-transpeptidase family protein n=1 Tax=Nocardioides sp. TaxID=35761 RepID=UPI00352915F4
MPLLRRLGLPAALLLAGLLTLESPLAAPAHADTVRLAGVDVRVTADTAQVVTVNRTRGHHARVAFWVRTDSGWKRRLVSKDGRIGYGGLVRGTKRKQGSGTTPLGTYRLLYVFGTQPADDARKIRYRRIRKGDFWVQDNRSAYYNRYRNRRQGGFRWRLPSSNANSSERLTDYPRQYELSVVTSFNRKQVRHRGSGIFLHVNGRGATAGCVSAPRPFLQRTVRKLDPARSPVIAIGR